MESRNITLTLDKAKEWYNSGNEALKEAALQAYTEIELIVPEWEYIKTYKDALIALRIYDSVMHTFNTPDEIRIHLKAIQKIDIIRKALNGDWKPSLVQGGVYYPYVRFYPAGEQAREAASSNNWKLGESFIADGKKYTLVGGDCSYCGCHGMAYFCYECGVVLPVLSLLGCKSREIAKHMSRYFSKEIFEAIYAQYIGMYQWV